MLLNVRTWNKPPIISVMLRGKSSRGGNTSIGLAGLETVLPSGSVVSAFREV